MQKTRDKSRKPARSTPKTKEQPSFLDAEFSEDSEADVAAAPVLPIAAASEPVDRAPEPEKAIESTEAAQPDALEPPAVNDTAPDMEPRAVVPTEAESSGAAAVPSPALAELPQSREPTVIGEIYHPGTGLSVAIVENPGKRTVFTAEALGIEFRHAKREKLEQQIHAQLDRIAVLEWTPLIEAYTRYTGDTNAYLSVDRYWVLAIPAGDVLRANWRVEQDDPHERFRRAFQANCPPGFGPPYPFMERGPARQRVWMVYADSVWNTLQQSLQKLRAAASATTETNAVSPRPSVYVPRLVPRYELHYAVAEQLIREHLHVEYSVLAGERWNPEGANVLEISLDGYDDSDRSVIEQVRNGERTGYALEILMRVLVEKHVLPEGRYLITARPE
jgi:hypothetical protein